MAQKKTDREYLNNIFLKERWRSETGIIIGAGIKKREFIDELEAMEEDDRGFVNFAISSRKDDPKKLSMYKDDFKPGEKEAPKAPYKPGVKTPAAKSTPPSKVTGKSAQQKPAKAPVAQDDETDDLPF